MSRSRRDEVGGERRRASVMRTAAPTVLAVVTMLACQAVTRVAGQESRVEHRTCYRTTRVDGHTIFYREAGPKEAPTLLLLHGLPSSSRMFEPLFARLSDQYHLVAPDYPGFGHSDWPDPKTFAYTFDHYAEIIGQFTQTLGLDHYTLYMQDYGGPVGFRMAMAHPERVDGLIVQDAVAHDLGLGANWQARRAFRADRAANEGWYLVHSTLITKDENKLGLIAGVHLIYVNAAGLDRLKRGGSTPYPDGTMFSDDVRDYSATDGVYVQGATRKAITLMVKDSKKYASTGAWGFQAWAGGDATKPIATDPVKQCFNCHVPQKAQDFTFSKYLE